MMRPDAVCCGVMAGERCVKHGRGDGAEAKTAAASVALSPHRRLLSHVSLRAFASLPPRNSNCFNTHPDHLVTASSPWILVCPKLSFCHQPSVFFPCPVAHRVGTIDSRLGKPWHRHYASCNWSGRWSHHMPLTRSATEGSIANIKRCNCIKLGQCFVIRPTAPIQLNRAAPV